MKLKVGDVITIKDKDYMIINCLLYKNNDYYIVSEFYEKFELKEPNIFMVQNNTVSNANTSDDDIQLKIITNQKEIENVLKTMKI